MRTQSRRDEPKSKRRTSKPCGSGRKSEWSDLRCRTDCPCAGSRRPVPANPDDDRSSAPTEVGSSIELRPEPTKRRRSRTPAPVPPHCRRHRTSNIAEPAARLRSDDESRSDAADPGNALAASVDDLAELARSVQDESAQDEAAEPASDSTALAADLVAEAVATFQEQQGDEELRRHRLRCSRPRPRSSRRWQKSLVDGERVSLEDMEAVLEEHYRSRTEHRPDPHGPEAGDRGRSHVGHGPGDGSRVRGPGHLRGRLRRGRDASPRRRPATTT